MDSADFESKSSRRIANSVMVSSALDEAGSASSKHQLAILDHQRKAGCMGGGLDQKLFQGPCILLEAGHAGHAASW